MEFCREVGAGAVGIHESTAVAVPDQIQATLVASDIVTMWDCDGEGSRRSQSLF
jgi:hypothetical protein